MTRPSPSLVAHWYAKLRAGGFRDIEGGRDLNKMHACTFRGGEAGHGPTVVLADFSNEVEVLQQLAEHPTAIYYRGLEHAARALRGRRRKLVLIASAGNAADAGRALNITRRGAAKEARRFAVEVGLLREAHGS